MKYLCAVLFLTFGCFSAVSSVCRNRNEERAKADDPTRVCRRACTTDSDCSGSLKKCQCDGYCGLSCFNPDAVCPNITLANGTITFSDNSKKYDTRANYLCNSGFILSGQSVRKCRSNRQWSHLPPTCIRSCPTPKRMADSFFDHRTESSDGIYRVGSTVSYKCKLGRNPSGNRNVTCQSSYTWSTLKLICILKDCGQPPAIENGDYTPKGKTTFATQIRYFCNKGFSTTDIRTTNLCATSGKWNRQPPTCERVQCAPPSSELENGSVDLHRGTSPWEYEDRITFQCKDGYLIDGKLSKLTVACNENGTWGEKPSCEADLNADFNFELEGYVAVKGSFRSKQYSTVLGIPDYGVHGSGLLSSVPYPMSPLQKICIQVSVKTNALTVQAFSGGKTIDLEKFSSPVQWVTEKLWLVTPVANQTKVQLRFSAVIDSWIDDIKVLPESDCAREPVPKQIGLEAPETTTSKGPETTKGSDLTTKKETTTDSNMTTQSGPVTSTPSSSSQIIIVAVLVTVTSAFVLTAFVYMIVMRIKKSKRKKARMAAEEEEATATKPLNSETTV